MELYIFDAGLNFIGALDGFTSLQWVRKYSNCGEFELHCLLNADTLTLLERGNIVWKRDDLEAGIIEYRQIIQDSTGKESIVAKGKFVSGYMKRRIIWGEEILQSTAEVAMRTLLTKHVISPTNTDRAIPNMILGTLQGYSESVNYQTSYKNVLDEIDNLCNLSSLGYRTRFDATNKKIIFEVYKGLDRTSGQSTNARAIFSQEFENVIAQQLTESLANYRNIVLVGGMGEGVLRSLVTVGTSTGLNRFEMFDDAKSLTNVVDGVTLSNPEYLLTLVSRGTTKLSGTMDIRTFDSSVNLHSNITYKTDFDLGDIVTHTSKKWGVTLDVRITEIKEIYEPDGMSISVTFGEPIPTLVSIINNKLK